VQKVRGRSFVVLAHRHLVYARSHHRCCRDWKCTILLTHRMIGNSRSPSCANVNPLYVHCRGSDDRHRPRRLTHVNARRCQYVELREVTPHCGALHRCRERWVVCRTLARGRVPARTFHVEGWRLLLSDIAKESTMEHLSVYHHYQIWWAWRDVV